MSGNPIKNQRKKPQRNLLCKETQKTLVDNQKMSFFVNLTYRVRTSSHNGWVMLIRKKAS